MTIDEMIEVLQAAKEWKNIECCFKSSNVWGLTRDPLWDFHNYEYRIKPTSKKRLMRVDELPYVFATHNPSISWLRLDFSQNQVEALASQNYEWSTDGITWLSFWVEEEA